MNNIFTNKEAYLDLRDFWKTYHAEGRHKAKPVGYPSYFKSPIGYHMISDLNRQAHLIYLAAMGRSLEKATQNIHEDTIHDILWRIRRGGADDAFNLFEGSIPAEYHEPIRKRIEEFLNAKLNELYKNRK